MEVLQQLKTPVGDRVQTTNLLISKQTLYLLSCSCPMSAHIYLFSFCSSLHKSKFGVVKVVTLKYSQYTCLVHNIIYFILYYYVIR